jgi:hypothetical protein
MTSVIGDIVDERPPKDRIVKGKSLPLQNRADANPKAPSPTGRRPKLTSRVERDCRGLGDDAPSSQSARQRRSARCQMIESRTPVA